MFEVNASGVATEFTFLSKDDMPPSSEPDTVVRDFLPNVYFNGALLDRNEW